MSFTGSNFIPSELDPLEVEILAAMLRRLPRGVVQGQDVAVQAKLELASDCLEASADEA